MLCVFQDIGGHEDGFLQTGREIIQSWLRLAVGDVSSTHEQPDIGPYVAFVRKDSSTKRVTYFFYN